MENYYVRILTKNMRNVYVEAHRRAMKEYYPPHLTGPGSRGVGLLDMVFFAQGDRLFKFFEKIIGSIIKMTTLKYHHFARTRVRYIGRK